LPVLTLTETQHYFVVNLTIDILVVRCNSLQLHVFIMVVIVFDDKGVTLFSDANDFLVSSFLNEIYNIYVKVFFVYFLI